MIVIDMDMPTKCMNCQLLGRDTMYCQVYPRKDLNLITVANGKPDWCPIKCDIDKIRAEIEKAIWEDVVVSLDGTDETRIPSLDPDDVFEIINKYKTKSEDKE